MAKKKQAVQANEFDETLAASKTFLDKYKKEILWGGGGLVAIVIAALLIHQFYITPRAERAQEAVYRAQQLFMDGDYEKALNGDGQSMGFLAVADQYGSTKAGNLAHLYAGLCYHATGKYKEAVDELEDFDGCGDDMVSPSALGALGNCYAELGQNDKAVSLLLKAADKADNNTISPACLIQAAEILEAQGKADKALECYRKVKSKYQQSAQYSEIDKYIERLAK